MNNYTATSGEAMTYVEAETPCAAAQLADSTLKEILAAHVSPGEPDYPSEMNVHDEVTGMDYGFTL